MAFSNTIHERTTDEERDLGGAIVSNLMGHKEKMSTAFTQHVSVITFSPSQTHTHSHFTAEVRTNAGLNKIQRHTQQ